MRSSQLDDFLLKWIPLAITIAIKIINVIDILEIHIVIKQYTNVNNLWTDLSLDFSSVIFLCSLE